MDKLFFIVAGLIGFFFAQYTAGKKEGAEGRLPTLRFRFKTHTLWLHHWLFSFCAIIALAFLHVHLSLLYGLCAGAIIQGLTYKDWYYVYFRTDSYPF